MDNDQAVQAYVAKQIEHTEKERSLEAAQSQQLQAAVAPTTLQKLGLALVSLRIVHVRTGLGGRMALTLEAPIAGEPLQPTVLRGGDIVRVEAPGGSGKAKGAGEDNEAAMSGVVVSVRGNRLVVSLGSGDEEVPGAWRERCTVRKLANDTTYRRILHALRDLSQSPPPLLGVLLGHAPRQTAADPVAFPPDSPLNESQRKAVRLAVQSRDVALVHGPPGTGKTQTVVEIVRQLHGRGSRVLVCAPSNTAVDNLVERLARLRPSIPLVRLGHAARILPAAAAYSLDAQASASDDGALLRDVRAELDAALGRVAAVRGSGARRRAHEEIRQLRREFRRREALVVERTVGSARVVLCTLGGAAARELRSQSFGVCIVDEATQATEAECWVAAARAPRLVLAGDHHQLPPTTRLPPGEAPATMFGRVLGLPGAACMLETQYRMHRAVAHVSATLLYGGRLVPHAAVADHLLRDLPGVAATDDTCAPLVLLDTLGAGMLETADPATLVLADAESKSNSGEAALVQAHVARLLAAGVAPGAIAVISPYTAQVRALKALMRAQHPEIEVGSVDGFQGREKDAVVLSLVRCNDAHDAGFLKDYRRINVAVTRARRHLCVVGDSETLGNASPFLSALFAHLEECADIRYVDQ
ncbi:P-loop containing nucleoside triphosphate hydrolase protein [Kickxella alabastrina]|uniref:P-loop containing nucleoside triphosphate hydrolase protein n=1 Tax=Kickxella alabastrina TaxID=61397 RepID=UPI002220D7F9|nr:P-loop containing nucleoside triphosphate hydrolase protein [Kickxella alabastrina]KAI7825949.1 P-loop containing nucleoside triphosphate hydrolase protein [Kickxella alabastrina]KAJ1947162.1 hypothetical protein GGF37_000617 [Kickxella alabastrina]